MRAETEVAVSVEPQCERVPVGHDEPLTYVKLGVVNQHRLLCNINMQVIANCPQLLQLDVHVTYATSDSTESIHVEYKLQFLQQLEHVFCCHALHSPI